MPVRDVDIGKLRELIAEQERLLGQPLEAFTAENFEDAFRLANLTPASFKTRKQRLKAYLVEKFGKSAPVVEELEKIQYTLIGQYSKIGTTYFKSLQQIRNTIDRLCEASGDYDGGRSDTAFAAMCLAWAGLSSGEAVEVKKAHLYGEQAELLLPWRDGPTPLPALAAEFLGRYAQSDGIERRIGEKLVFVPYKEGGWLLRTIRAEKLEEAGMRNLFSNLNRRLAGKTFSYHRIYVSGQFDRLLSYEEKHPNAFSPVVPHKPIPEEEKRLYEQILGERFEVNQKLKYKLTQYLEWKRCFYPLEDNRE